MIPPVGSMPKVKGKRAAIPVGAPMPGIAPMDVPKMTLLAMRTCLRTQPFVILSLLKNLLDLT